MHELIVVHRVEKRDKYQTCNLASIPLSCRRHIDVTSSTPSLCNMHVTISQLNIPTDNGFILS